MAKIVQAKDVENVIRNHLTARHFELSPEKDSGQNGADIIAQKDGFTYFIEVIGFQETRPIRSREFYECFFRAISRDRGNDKDFLVMALPVRFKNGMRQRKQRYPVSWDKLGKAFANLTIWYVDTQTYRVQECTWSNPYDS